MKRISKNDYEIALGNGISQPTVYRRVQAGWTIKKAITTPTDHKHNSKRERSQLFGIERGKLRSFKLPLNLEERWENMVSSSGLTEMDLATEIIMKFLQ